MENSTHITGMNSNDGKRSTLKIANVFTEALGTPILMNPEDIGNGTLQQYPREYLAEGDNRDMGFRKRKRRSTWTDDSERSLIELWEECAEEANGQNRNKLIVEQLVARMRQRGYDYESSAIDSKIRNLLKKFKEESDLSASPSAWFNYNKLSASLGEPSPSKGKAVLDNIETYTIHSDSDEENNTLTECVDLSSLSAQGPEPELDPEPPAGSLTDNEPIPFNDMTIGEVKRISTTMNSIMAELVKNDAKMIQLQQELIDIERKRNEILIADSSSSLEFQKNVIVLLSAQCKKK